MEINAKKLNEANASAEATISGDIIKNKEEKILRALAKDAKVDGFRRGKVPSSVIKARYGDKVKADAEQEAVRDLYADAVKQLGLDENSVVGEPTFLKFNRKENGDLDVELKISYKPFIALDSYEECIPQFETPETTKAEIQERLNVILESSAPLKNIEADRGVENGDFVVIDFEGFIDGQPFENGKAQNFTLEIGSKNFIAGFEDALIGLPQGQSKDIDVTFPQEYGSKELAGKQATFKVKLHEIKQKDIPLELSEEILKKFLPNEPQPTKELFEEKIAEQIKKEKSAKLYQEELKPKFVDAIVKKFKFDLPDNIVEQEMDLLFRNAIAAIKPEELEEYKKDRDKAVQKRESYRKDAEDSVKLTFVINELAILKNISVSDQEVAQMIYLEALQQGQDPKTHLDNYKKQGILPAIRMAITEDKLFHTLFDKADKGKK